MRFPPINTIIVLIVHHLSMWLSCHDYDNCISFIWSVSHSTISDTWPSVVACDNWYSVSIYRPEIAERIEMSEKKKTFKHRVFVILCWRRYFSSIVIDGSCLWYSLLHSVWMPLQSMLMALFVILLLAASKIELTTARTWMLAALCSDVAATAA